MVNALTDLPIDAVRSVFEHQSPDDICSTMYASSKIWNGFKGITDRKDHSACIALRKYGTLESAFIKVSRQCGLNTIKGMSGLFTGSISHDMYQSAAIEASRIANENCYELFKYLVDEHGAILDLGMLNDAINAGADETVRFIIGKGLGTFSYEVYSNTFMTESNCKKNPLTSAIMRKNSLIFDELFQYVPAETQRFDFQEGLRCSTISDNVHAFIKIRNHPIIRNDENFYITNGYSLWLTACQYDSIAIMKFLRHHHPIMINLNIRTCLVERNHLEIVKDVMNSGQFWNSFELMDAALSKSSLASQDMLCTLLHTIKHRSTKEKDYNQWGITAADNGKLDLLKVFTLRAEQEKCLKRNENGKGRKITLISRDNHGIMMAAAVKKGHYEIVKYLMEELGVPFNSQLSEAACKSTNIDLLKYLLEKPSFVISDCAQVVNLLLSSVLNVYPYIDQERDPAKLKGLANDIINKAKIGILISKNGINFNLYSGVFGWLRTGDEWMFEQIVAQTPSLQLNQQSRLQACFLGATNVVKKLDYQIGLIDDCFRIAVKMNYLELVEFINGRPYSFHRGKALIEAIKTGNMGPYTMLMNNPATWNLQDNNFKINDLRVIVNLYLDGDNELAAETLRMFNSDRILSQKMLKTIHDRPDLSQALSKMKKVGSKLTENAPNLAIILVRENNLDKLKILIDSGFEMTKNLVQLFDDMGNAHDKTSKLRPLQIIFAVACHSGHLQIVKFLLEKYADELVETDFLKALKLATSHGHKEVAIHLIEHDTGHLYSNRRVIETFKLNWIEDVVKVFVREKKALPEFTLLLEDILLIAIKKESVAVVKECLLAGVNPNTGGGDALIFAVGKENEEIVKILLAASAIEVNAKNGAALRAAAMLDNSNIMLMLLRADADPTLVDDEALNLVCGRGNNPQVTAMMCNAQQRKRSRPMSVGGKVRPQKLRRNEEADYIDDDNYVRNIPGDKTDSDDDDRLLLPSTNDFQMLQLNELNPFF